MPKSEHIQNWVKLADEKLGRLAHLTHPIAGHERFDTEERVTLGLLLGAALRASGSALLLVEEGRVWDADIVSRSGLEATMKLVHLLSDEAQFETRHHEFAVDLPAIASLHDHEKARRLLDAAPTPDPGFHRPFTELLLSAEEHARLSDLYPKTVRRRLTTAWGMTGIVEEMVRSGKGMGKYAVGLLHGYSMASHVAHADPTGVGIVMERECRSPERRKAVHDAHAGRLVSDQVWHFALRLLTAYRFVGRPTRPIHALLNDDSELWRELYDVQRDWYRIEYGIDLDRESFDSG